MSDRTSAQLFRDELLTEMLVVFKIKEIVFQDGSRISTI